MDRNAFFDKLKTGTASGAYMFTGVERYIADSAVKRLVALIDPSVRELNYNEIADNTTPASAVIAACETAPFLAEMRLVIVRYVPRAEDGAALAKYIAKLPPYTTLIFDCVGAKLDKRTALYKAMGEARTVDFSPLTQSEAAKWISQRLSAEGSSISQADAYFFATVAGADCATLANEAAKAAMYAGAGSSVTKDVINKVVTKDLDFIVFNILDDALAKRSFEAFTALSELIEGGEKPMDIARLLAQKALRMIQVRKLIDKNTARDAIASKIGAPPNQAAAIYNGAKRLSPSRAAALERSAVALNSVALETLRGRGRDRELLEKALMELAAG